VSKNEVRRLRKTVRRLEDRQRRDLIRVRDEVVRTVVRLLREHDEQADPGRTWELAQTQKDR
jgi:hypothetical protein